MRNFIVSDLHGDGNAYNSIISYLENVASSSDEEVTLYINGDLIDRGYDSARMLLDVISRMINSGPFKVEYLAGNHELMMWQDCHDLEHSWPVNSVWFHNGGYKTAFGFEAMFGSDKLNDNVNNIVNFISNLKIYHKFNETLNGKKNSIGACKMP
ncbi:MAG: hypothetical protein IJ565_03425 [Bacilli bacterium]|nr:hypothetical protein [Bacilli bacterium]